MKPYDCAIDYLYIVARLPDGAMKESFKQFVWEVLKHPRLKSIEGSMYFSLDAGGLPELEIILDRKRVILYASESGASHWIYTCVEDRSRRSGSGTLGQVTVSDLINALHGEFSETIQRATK